MERYFYLFLIFLVQILTECHLPLLSFLDHLYDAAYVTIVLKDLVHGNLCSLAEDWTRRTGQSASVVFIFIIIFVF
jgi:hypothetical protein